MFKEIFLFELKYRLKRPATYAYFLIFFIMVFYATMSNDVTIGENTGNMIRNSPFVIFRITTIMSILGMLVISAIMSTPVIRDSEHELQQFLYSYPLKKFDYLAGRYLGSFVFALFVFLSIPLGIILGSVLAPALGVIPQNKFADFDLMSYLRPFVIIVVPNILFVGSIFFCLASLTRKMVYSYLGNVLLLVLYLFAVQLIVNLKNYTLVSLVDPFAIGTFNVIVKYWSTADSNTLQVPLTKLLIINRLMWSMIGLGLFVFTYVKFKLSTFSETRIKSRKIPLDNGAETEYKPIEFAKTNANYGFLRYFNNMIKTAVIEFKTVVRELPFLGIVAAGVGILITNSVSIGGIGDTSTYPVTYNMIEGSLGNFIMIILIIITFYSGEIVWREKQYKIDQIINTMPVPSWVTVCSKIIGLYLILILLYAILMVVDILTQAANSFFVFNLPLYFTDLFTIQLPQALMIATLAIFIQTIVSNKFVGHFIMLMFYILVWLVMPKLGLEHNMLRFSQFPVSTYSDINKYGHFLTAVRWYQLYWFAFSILLIVATVLIWQRSYTDKLRQKLVLVKQNFSTNILIVTIVSLLIFIFSGCIIYYNTVVFNKYNSSSTIEEKSVKYEKLYKKYENISQPKIVSINTNVDIFPYERAIYANGYYILKNKTLKNIDSIHVNISNDMNITELKIGDGSEIVLNDLEFGYYIVKLAKPLKPNDSIKLTFNVNYKSVGFKDKDNKTTIVYNGTFINNAQFMPGLGYDNSNEITNKDKRKKYNLPPRKRMASINDSAARMSTYLGPQADWIDFETTVSTASDQTVLVPGYLTKEWTENGRTYKHFKMDSKILAFFNYSSGKYELLKDKWNNILLEIYYQKGHEFNINKMMDAMKLSLDYFSNNFSPFQFRQLRIVEFPRYDAFAQSFANTIPFSENIGFILNTESEDAIDYPYYITAHEIAHQWWAHQVIGANVQGATMMSEAFAQYSALMVMKKKYGKEQMRKFLKYELDKYLRGRKTEIDKELPLYLCENQPYIHYRKGSVIMYALQDYIGEDNVNKIMAKYISLYKFQNAPFTVSTDYLKLLRENIPDSMKYLVKDMFETITLFSNSAKEVVATRLPDGKYKVDITYEATKYRADSLGKETPVIINDYIDIGVFGNELKNGKKIEKELYLKKYKIDKNKGIISVIVNEKPENAGIDPYNKLIDRVSDDNLKDVVLNKN